MRRPAVKKHQQILGVMLGQRKMQMIYKSNDEVYLAALTTVFGPPVQCLLCDMNIIGQAERPLDLDSWFCSKCCPVCAL